MICIAHYVANWSTTNVDEENLAVIKKLLSNFEQVNPYFCAF